MEKNQQGMKNGFYRLTIKEEGIFLAVFPPEEDGEPVETESVISELEKKEIEGYDKKLVEDTVMNMVQDPVRIGDAGSRHIIDAQAKVTVLPDRMKAYVMLVEPDGGKEITAETIRAELAQHDVVFGIKEDVIESLEQEPVYNEMICVADGVAAVDGKDGMVKYHFDTRKYRPPAIMEDGTVNFRELNTVQNVKKGEMLCTIIPPEKAKKGMTVTGEEIKAHDGKAAKVPRGKNVQVSEDGSMIFAAIDGEVEKIDEKVSVFATYEVKADVDTSTGNIKFIGNIVVRGNVLSGYKIEAGGSVEVWGVVEGAHITAQGDIVLKSGMQGMGKGVLVSGRDIVSKYIENSTVTAAGDIKSEAIMHSHIKCGHKLELTGRKGLLVGGTCRVGNEIQAMVIGSSLSGLTDVEVGMDPELREEYKKVRDTITDSSNAVKKADQAIKLLKKIALAGFLTGEKKELLQKSVRTKHYHEKIISDMKQSRREIEEKMRREAAGRIRCTNYVFPGTRITIGSSSMYVRETLKYCAIFREGADIKWSPLR